MEPTAPATATGGPIRRTRAPVRPRRTQAGQRVSRVTFTLNNWTQAEYDDLVARAPTFKWIIIGKEVAESGTPHLQGAIVFGGQVSFSTLKLWPGLQRAHIEPMVKDPHFSLVYCSKEDTAPFISGELPEPGKRSDVAAAVERIQAGDSLQQLAASAANGVAIVKFSKGLTVLRSLLSSPRDPARPPKVYWLYGETGTEKTRSCFELGNRLHPGSVWISPGGTLRWFDGYDGQRVAILDDFRSKGVQFNFLLRLLDRYPTCVEFKGGFVNWAPELIFITTTKSIRDTFEGRLAHRAEDVRQLERRITQSFGFPEERPEFDALFALRGEPRLAEVLAVASAPPMNVEEEEEWVEGEIDKVISPIAAISLSSDDDSFELFQ